MSISSRIHDTIEDWVVEWRDRLRGWMISWTVGGILDALEDMLPEQKGAVDSILKRLIDEPLVPDDIKGFLRMATERGNPLIIAAAVIMIPLMVIPMVFAVFAPLGNLLTQKEEKLLRTHRLDPLSVITAWRRDPETYEKYFEDLKEQGWSDERIEALKFFTLFYPAPADLVRWQAREVFEPAMIEKYGLDDEFGGIDLEPFRKAGMTDEQSLNYWRAHWEHASWMQVVEMLHRGLVTEAEVYDWFRVVEIVPYWRDLLIQTAYTWPTRVDVRRWWDMRTIDETELRRLYSGMGYRGVNLDNYVLWTKVYVAFPDLMARWTKGWITIDDVRAELVALGMPADRVEEMIQQKIGPQEPERVEDAKSLTKTEIYKGVKKEVITWDEGIELLTDLGYDYDEADYILTINVEALAGSPETFEEFKGITQKYRIAAGREEAPMPEELKAAAAELVKIKREVEALEIAVKEERRLLTAEEEVPDSASAKLKRLQVTLNRARAELQRIQLDYNSQVAAWKHGAR
uniref:Uncharacterized protein n=1 Tax=viral metagenome TaxID=1070528 RepID=A0A6H2A1H6_9ZZZZ